MNNARQATINETLWGICQSLHVHLDPIVSLNHLFALLLAKQVSDGQLLLINERAFDNEDAPTHNGALSRIRALYVAHHIDLLLRSLEEEGITPLSGIKFDDDLFGTLEHRDAMLAQVLESLNGLASITEQECNAASTFLLDKTSITTGKGEAHYTPPFISYLMAKIMDIKAGDYVFDPACGSGSLLLQCAGDKVTLFGQELHASSARLSQLNLLLHGERGFQVEVGDSLRDPKYMDGRGLQTFDVVVSVPPFVLDDWGHDELQYGHNDRFCYGLPTKGRGHLALIQLMIASMNRDSGRMAVVVPSGVLFRQGKEQEIRKHLIDDHLLDTVIALPGKLFYDSSSPSAILVFKRNSSRVRFIDAAPLCDIGRAHNSFSDESIQMIASSCQNERVGEEQCFTRLVSIEETAKNDYNLAVGRYVEAAGRHADENPERIDLSELLHKGERLKMKLIEFDGELESIIQNNLREPFL